MVDLVAADIAFDKHELRVAADTPWTLHYTNQDSFAHDVVIVDANNEEVFRVQPFSGPDATDDFAVPALPAGEYTFYCEIHPVPEMTGTLIVE